MKRVFCDGCFKAGIMNDLTGRNDSFRVLIDSAHYIDLCAERCAPLFDRFDAERRRIALESKDTLRSDIDNLTEKLWEDLSGGKKEK